MTKLFQATMLFIAFIVLALTSAFGAPFIVSDPDPAGIATKCVYQEGTNPSQETPALAFACHIDVSVFSIGSHTINVWFRPTAGGLNGLIAGPFTFTRDNPALAAPVNIRIEP